MTDKAAALPTDKGMMIVAKDEKALGKFMDVAKRQLAIQATVLSKHTGLSVGYCSEIVLHRAMRRVGATGADGAEKRTHPEAP